MVPATTAWTYSALPFFMPLEYESSHNNNFFLMVSFVYFINSKLLRLAISITSDMLMEKSDTTLKAESKEELKSLFDERESEKLA